jgi:uncharacterized protein
MIVIVVVLLIGVILVALPGYWIHSTIEKHAGERPDLGGTGAEFARHALDGMKLHDVKVEVTEQGDHYDPETRAVRLQKRFHDGRSVSAVAIAAHEVGHAMQHALDLPMFARRLKIARQAHVLGLVAQAFVWTAPVLLILNKSVAALVLNIVGFGGMALLSFILQAMTLPVEFDASFNRAMPLLREGQFLRPADLGAARQLLKAAAYTYVAGLIRSVLIIPGLGRLPRF